jgi:phospho-acceptor domain-containing protein
VPPAPFKPNTSAPETDFCDRDLSVLHRAATPYSESHHQYAELSPVIKNFSSWPPMAQHNYWSRDCRWGQIPYCDSGPRLSRCSGGFWNMLCSLPHRGRCERDDDGAVFRVEGFGELSQDIFQVTQRHPAARLTPPRIEELLLAERRKDEFLAMLSHEPRSPLASIHTALGMWRTQSGDDVRVQHKMHELIERQVRQMALLTSGLMDISPISFAICAFSVSGSTCVLWWATQSRHWSQSLSSAINASLPLGLIDPYGYTRTRADSNRYL